MRYTGTSRPIVDEGGAEISLTYNFEAIPFVSVGASRPAIVAQSNIPTTTRSKTPMKRHAIILLGLLMTLAACESRVVVGPEGPRGPEGPQGPQGPQGPASPALEVQVATGTILNRNYTEMNPHHASIPLSPFGNEPTVLFLGIENENGVYYQIDFSSVIWGGSNSDYSVPGTSGWYALVYDRYKERVSSNYQVKFVQ